MAGYRQTGSQGYLAEHVRVGVVLQQHGGGARVVVAGGDVQRGEADFALGAVVDEQGDNVLVSLLKSHGQRGKAILDRGGGELLPPPGSGRELSRPKTMPPLSSDGPGKCIDVGRGDGSGS